MESAMLESAMLESAMLESAPTESAFSASRIKNRCVAWSLGAFVLACSGAPAANPVLLNDDLRPLLPEEVVETLSEPSDDVELVELPGGGVLQVHTTSATTDEGGYFLLDVDFVVDEAAGWTMSVTRAGVPINRGAQTGRAAQMAQSYLITSRRDVGVRAESREVLIQVSRDGALVR